MLLNVTNVILPVLICAAAGYGLAVFKAPFDKRVVGSLVANIGYPTLIISHLSGSHVRTGAFIEVIAAATAVVGAFGVISLVFLKSMHLPVRAYLSPMMNNNVGNIGLPITLLAFGDAGMAYTMGFVVVVLVSMFTIGMWVPSGKFSLRSLLTSPIIYSVVLVLLLMTTGTDLPKPIQQSFSILGGLSIPLMLLTLGYTVATLKIGNLWRGCYLSVFHIVMAACVGAAVTSLFGFSGTERGVVILCSLMPVSVATYLFVDRYVPDEAPDVAGYILISTLMTIIVLPLALTFWVNPG